MRISTNEPKMVNAIPIKKLVELLDRFAKAHPDSLVTMNEGNGCLDLYKNHSKNQTDRNYEWISQLLWE